MIWNRVNSNGLLSPLISLLATHNSAIAEFRKYTFGINGVEEDEEAEESSWGFMETVQETCADSRWHYPGLDPSSASRLQLQGAPLPLLQRQRQRRSHVVPRQIYRFSGLPQAPNPIICGCLRGCPSRSRLRSSPPLVATRGTYRPPTSTLSLCVSPCTVWVAGAASLDFPFFAVLAGKSRLILAGTFFLNDGMIGFAFGVNCKGPYSWKSDVLDKFILEHQCTEVQFMRSVEDYTSSDADNHVENML